MMSIFFSLLMMMEDTEGNLAKFDAFIDPYKDDLKKLEGEQKMEIIRRIIKMRNYDEVDACELRLLLRPVGNSYENNHDRENNFAPLPEKFRRRIENMNGSNPVLVIQKELFKTDVSPHHGRLAMPESQIREEFFLFHEELQLPEIKATLIGPSRQFECCVTLKKWNMAKKSHSVKSRRVTSTYNLVSGWNSFVSANHLREGMAVQVWAFRKESKLCFALVKVGGDDEDEEDE
ncbi:B3 domain-containing protein At2g24670-like [Diospyros lotus]|uniref:B3 domain-containing protein At2g24670-like n=1 Tax=Diospyros lotus TaxID=55363 RepID=UPI00224ED7DD|nr:B3 domain-containing protein At2g24670-like [Diospyros lotus]XP_052210742.1 B3 domain-containing protein At2g24670-like [Diospyros lotus]